MNKLANFRRPSVDDEDYRRHLRNQPCVVSGYEYSEMGGQGVDPSHISFGNFARGMKANVWHCLPLRHDLHLKCDAGNQARFWHEAFAEDPWLMMRAVKAMSEMKYLRWCLDTGKDVEAAVRDITDAQ
jgi:hypothetical protein